MEIDLTKTMDMSTLVPRVWNTKYPIYLLEFGGAIGAGKSETAEEVYMMLKGLGGTGKYDIRILREDIQSAANKKAIDDFYNGNGSPVELERQICGSRLEMLLKTIESHPDTCSLIIVSDRAIEDDLVFIRSILRTKVMSENEKSELAAIVDNISEFVRELDEMDSAIMHTTIYLEPTPEEALARIRKRGRPNEQQIDKATLRRLTGESDKLICKDVVSIDNSDLTVLETGTLSALVLWNRLDIIDNVLVSVYGVPGVGKSKLASVLTGWLQMCEPRNMNSLIVGVPDRSDDEDIKAEQSLVYEGHTGAAMSPDSMQNWIDNRRLGDFESSRSFYPSALLTITDVGPRTSEVFCKATGCSEEHSGYREWFRNQYHKYLNVVVQPAAGGYRNVREHIKERGRPGEYEYFTEERLQEIGVLISVRMEEVKFDTNWTTVFTTNGYTKATLSSMFRDVMKALHALIRYTR